MTAEKKHWERIYSENKSRLYSWTQENPKTSIDFIHKSGIPKTANIIDIGGGDSKLAGLLIDEGYENITVLDISLNALNAAKDKLREKSKKIKWIVSDVTKFKPEKKYDFWHDRAAFHFLTSEKQILKYLEAARNSVNENGYVTIGTFSENGPDKCSGLNVKQYSEDTLTNELKIGFEKIKCIFENHKTPFNSVQNFLFCFFRRSFN